MFGSFTAGATFRHCTACKQSLLWDGFEQAIFRFDLKTAFTYEFLFLMFQGFFKVNIQIQYIFESFIRNQTFQQSLFIVNGR